MSCVLVFAPAVVAGWPAISTAITAAVGALGFTLARTAELERADARVSRAEIELADSHVLCDSLRQEIVVARGDVVARFWRDPRGSLRLSIAGGGHTTAELRALGDALVGRVTQQFVYHRLVTELRERGLAIVEEHLAADHTVRLRVRNFQHPRTRAVTDEAFEIEISPQGQVRVRTQGIKGARCLECSRLFSEIFGPAAATQLTGEYYEPPDSVSARAVVERQHIDRNR